MTAEAENLLIAHDWPGNARELRNVLEHAYSNLDGEVIDLSHLPLYLTGRPAASPDGPLPGKLSEIMAKAEKEALRAALAQARNNKAEAARQLGIHRTLFYRKLKKHGLM